MRLDDWLDPSGLLLGEQAPVPLGEPFTLDQAFALGIPRHLLRKLEAAGLIRRVLRGVYAASQYEDTVRSRAAAVRLVLPPSGVIVDRTAGWLHGMPVLQRGAHLKAPPLEVCQVIDAHMRRPEIDGRRRFTLLERDVVEVFGIPVTTPCRTTLDLGRRLWRYDAMSAIDAGLRIGVDHDELFHEMPRFKGQRGVVQLRALAPLADRRAESPGESALRLRWYEAGLPTPEPQFEISDQFGELVYRLDVPLPELRFAAEYDGEEFHSTDEDVAKDLTRRQALWDIWGWDVRGFRKDEVYDPRSEIDVVLNEMFHQARRRYRRWSA